MSSTCVCSTVDGVDDSFWRVEIVVSEGSRVLSYCVQVVLCQNKVEEVTKGEKRRRDHSLSQKKRTSGRKKKETDLTRRGLREFGRMSVCV